MTVLGDSGTSYTVSVQNGGLHCTCPAFRFGQGMHCKHIVFARDQISQSVTA